MAYCISIRLMTACTLGMVSSGAELGLAQACFDVPADGAGDDVALDMNVAYDRRKPLSSAWLF